MTAQVRTPETAVAATAPDPPSHFDPHSDNCYNNDMMALEAHFHAEDRVALVENTAKGWQDLGFYIKSAGDENEYLLFSSEPENADKLRQFADSMRSNESVMTNFCMEGFKIVQFITRDRNMHQTLVAEIATSVKASWR